MTITPEEIARLRALEAKATPGPWEHDAGMPIRSNRPNDYELVSVDVYGYAEFTNPSNSHLIVAMRNALPRLLDEIERLRAEAANWHNLRPVYADAEREAAELRADLREAVALLDGWASPSGHVEEWNRRVGALLAKHKEDA